MSRTQLTDLSQDLTLDADQLQAVRGGVLIGLLLPAVQKAVGDPTGLLVSNGPGGASIGLLLPAVQKVRDAAAR